MPKQQTQPIELVPVGAFIFLDRDVNPAEMFPNTSWEQYDNSLYITTEGKMHVDSQGRPTGTYKPLRCWIRRG